MGNKLTHQYVADFFQQHGCELLDEYANSSRPMNYRCQCGNISKSNWNNFTRGKRCQHCLRQKRSGSSGYQWRTDRERIVIRKRYVGVVARLVKQVPGVTKSYSTTQCEYYFGVTFDELCQWLKIQPGFGMSDWEIDHVYPVWAFTEAGIFDLHILNGLDNLRVVQKATNRQKCYKFNPVAFVDWLKRQGVCVCGTMEK